MNTVLNGYAEVNRSIAIPSAMWRRARIAASGLFLMNGILFANWVSRIPAVQQERGLSHATLGAALFALGIGAVASMPIAGWWGHRAGSAKVCRWSALALCTLLPFPAFVPGFLGLVITLFCIGMVHGALDVAMNAQAVAVEHHYARPVMSSFHAQFSLGGLIGSLTGGLAASAGLSLLTHFVVVGTLLAAAVFFWMSPYLLERGIELPEVAAADSEPAVASPLESRGSKVPIIAALGMIAFCAMMGEGAIGDWSALFLRQELGASEGLAAAGYAAFSVTMAVGRFSGDALSARFGPVALVRGSGILAIIGLAFVLMGNHALLAFIGFAILGAGFAIVVPQAFSAAGRLSNGAASKMVAAVTAIGYLGFLLGPPLIGLAAEHIGLRAALGLLFATSLTLVVLAQKVRNERNAHGQSTGGRLT